MCRVDDADRVEMLQSGQRKARKEHRCDECGRTITVGEFYLYEGGVFEGDLQVYKTCAHCLVGRKWLWDNCGGHIFTQVCEEIQEHAQEYPAIAFPLYRFAVGVHRKWKSFRDDGLMPVPQALPPLHEDSPL